MIYEVSSGVTSTGLRLSSFKLDWNMVGDTIRVSSGGVAINTTLTDLCKIHVLSGGTAINTVATSETLFQFDVAPGTYIQGTSGGIAYEIKNGYASGIELVGHYFPGGMGLVDPFPSPDPCVLTVLSGGSADLIMLRGGELHVFGGIANSTTISGGGLHVSSGGTANYTTVSGGCIHVSSGGKANATTVSSGGGIHVSSGGTATNLVVANGASLGFDVVSDTYIQGTLGGSTFEMKDASISSFTVAGGTLNVSSGGTANGTIVNSGGCLSVFKQGSALEIVENGGYVKIEDGANVTFAPHMISGVVLSYGSTTLHSGTTANSTTIHYGNLEVLSGGVASDITVSGGSLFVSSGGTVNDVSLINVASLYLFGGGTANNITLSSSGRLYVFSGGSADNIALDSDSILNVSSGGTATKIAWTPCIGKITIDNDAYVTFDSQCAGVFYGSFNQLLSSATVMESKSVGSITSMYVMSGGTAKNTTIYSGGSLYIFGGGTAYHTEVSSGDIYVMSGGTANDATISLGYMSMMKGGMANSITVNHLGRLYVSDGGAVNSITITSGGTLSVSSGGTANNTTINSGGTFFVSSGGTANNTTVNSSGLFRIDGTADSTTVNSGTNVYVYGGGKATNIIWTPCVGNITIANGAYVTFASQYSGVYYGSDDQLLSHATMMESKSLSGGRMYVMAGGTAKCTEIMKGVLYVSGSGVMNDTMISAGSVCIFSDGTANRNVVNGGYIFVNQGGLTNSTTVNGGSFYVYTGGTANSTTVNSGGVFIISGSGTANSTTVNSGGKFSINGGTADHVRISAGGSLHVNGTATNLVWTPCVGSISFGNNAYVTFASQYSGVYFGSGNQLLSHATVMESKTIDTLNCMYVMSGGTANHAVVNNGGELIILSGGKANRTTINNSGRLRVYSGGTANSAMINSGYLIVYRGGTAAQTVFSNGQMEVVSGGMVNDTTLVHCWGRISSGGTANRTTIGGQLDVHDGGTANDTVVNSGGYLIVFSEGKLTGRMTFNNGAVVSMHSGSILDFDLTHASANTVALVNDLSIIQGTPVYTITIDETQEEGTYHLASGVSGFTHSITFVNTSGEQLGTISVGGNVGFDDRNYSLLFANDELVLSVYEIDNTAPVVSNVQAVSSGQSITITADFTDNIAVVSRLYRIGWDEPWQSYSDGVTVSENTIVFFKAVDASGNESEIVNYLVTGFVDSNTEISSDVVVSGGTRIVSSGQIYCNTNIGSYGFLYVSSGGLASNSLIKNNGFLLVFSDGIANENTISSGANLYVSSGGLADNTVVSASGSLRVYSGGYAGRARIYSGANLYVSSGGTIDNTTLYSGVSFHAAKGETVINTMVSSGANLYVSSGGLVDNTAVSFCGMMHVLSGGTANHTRIYSSASLYVSNGGTANGTVVDGSSTFSSSTSQYSSSFIDGDGLCPGFFHVGSGGTANDTTVLSGGRLFISGGGTANNTIVEGYFNILSDFTTGSSLHRSCYGAVTVSAGGTANYTTVNSYGILTVSRGGTANNVSVNSDGRIDVTSGGKVTGQITFNRYAEVFAHTGAIFDFDLTRTSAGAAALMSGLSRISSSADVVFTLTVDGTPENGQYNLADGLSSFKRTLTVQNVSGTKLGTLSVDQKITIDNTAYSLNLANGTLSVTVFEADTVAPMVINVKATPDTPTNRDVTVTAEFTDNVAVAATLYRIGTDDAWQPYMDGVTVSENTTVYFKAVDTYGNESEIVSYQVNNIDNVPPEKPTASADITDPTNRDVTVTAFFSEDSDVGEYSTDGETWTEYTNAIVFKENGTVWFRGKDAAGNISETTCFQVENIDKTLTIPDTVAPVVTNVKAITAPTEDRVTVTADFTDDVAVVAMLYRIGTDDAWQPYMDGVTVSENTTIYFKAVDAAGNESEIVSYQVTNIGNKNGVVVSSGATVIVSSGETYIETVVNAGGKLHVCGTANGTMINVSGSMFVSSNGTANSTTLNTSATLIVSSGGTATDTTVKNSASFIVSSGGTANSTTVNTKAAFVISSGGTAMDTTVDSQGTLRIVNGGTATGIVASAGAQLAFNVTSDTYVQGTYDGSAFEMKNACISNYRLNAGCSLDVISGGTATNIVADSGAKLNFAVASNTYLQGTRFDSTFEMKNACLSGYTAYGGQIDICSGGTAVDTTINIGSYSYTYNNGNASSYFFGALIVSSGGTAINTTVNTPSDGSVSSFTGGSMFVCNGGTAIDTTVNTSGFVFIQSGGKLTGHMTFASKGAYVSVFSGGILDFDLTRMETGTVALVNDLSIVKGTPIYTLTVDGTTADGTYKLAEGASAFSQTITVVDTSGAELGILSVGEKVTLGDTDYLLNLDDGTLSLRIGSDDEPEPEPEPDVKKLFLTGDFSGIGKAMLVVNVENNVAIYRNNGLIWTELTLEDGWSIAGVGDFNGDGADDILRVHTSGLLLGEFSDGYGEFAPQVLNLKNEGWSILGTGDFNGDDSDDVLIANPTGASETVGLLGYWKNGTEWTLINGYSAEWEMVSCGDFNGDGKCDMLWKNSFEGEGGGTYNAYCTWIVEPPAGQSDWRMVSVADPSEWNFLCTGDFDGNGSHDIAMINDVGVVGIWGVLDGYLSSWSILSAVTSEWQLAGVGDFNGDGTDDIAWCNTDTGLTGCWQIENKELASWHNIATIK